MISAAGDMEGSPLRVLAFLKYGSRAASTRQRLLQYLPYLARHGVHVECLPLLGNDHVSGIAKGRRAAIGPTIAAYARRVGQLLTRREHDLLWVHYELFPYFPGLFERLSGLSGAPVICDYDDATFHMYDAHPSRIVRRILGNKLVPLLRGASACVCGNTYLETYAARYCEHTTVIPTVVDTQLYRPSGDGTKDGPRVVGWIGSPSTWRHVAPFAPRLARMLAENNATMRVIGGGPSSYGIPGVDAREWAEEREAADVQAMDIGIMPVPDDMWSRGKCGYKLIQYMACCLPVVASPIGVNVELVKQGENGFLASTAEQWEAALLKLLGDHSLCQKMGNAGRLRVEARYSLASQQPKLLEILRTASRQKS